MTGRDGASLDLLAEKNLSGNLHFKGSGSSLPVIETAETDIKERMSLGVVTLIAARAGCEVSSTQVDRVSRDVRISPISGELVTIDAQLKATVNLIHDGPVVKYDLDVKNYNDLRATQVGNAQILIVLDLHELDARWLRASRSHLVFDKCAYWVSLYDAPPTTNAKKIRVSIPRDQVFTPGALEEIMTRRFDRIKDHHGGL